MTIKVLIVDDEERVLGLAKATLEIDERYEITMANDGDEAIAACLNDKPDLIVLDMLMPKKDGVIVCREIRESPELKDVKIVMLTAMSQEADKQTALMAGADDYMTKPFSPAALLVKVEQILGL
jgi:DNA-binding response OmpR family regulator